MSEAVLVDQTGITNLELNQDQKSNEIVLSRTPTNVGAITVNFVLDGITTGETSTANFIVRLTTYSNKSGTGAAVHDMNVSMVRAKTSYAIRFGFPGTASVGSLRLEICDDPIPDLPCTTIPGLDVSNAILASQTGETGFNITQRNTNELVLSRTAKATGLQANTYVLDNVQNPSYATTFYIRITSYASTDASGNFIDYGGVASAATNNIGLQTQVPPVLSFCVGLVVAEYNCTVLEGGNFVDFGNMVPTETYSTQSQIVSRTNAQDGYSISVYGIGITAGNKAIPSLEVPTLSAPGNNQFGLNIVANTTPLIGADQDGPGLVASLNPDYSIPDQYVYRSGDTILSVPGVTNFKRFTVSYVLNISPDQPPGVYGTTITYVCVGYF